MSIKVEKKITLDRGSFMGKKDYTLEDYLQEWKIQFEKMYQQQKEVA